MAVPNVAVNDIIKIRVVGENATQNMVNVGYFRVSAVGGLSVTLATIAANFDTLYTADYQAVMHNSGSILGWGAQRILPGPPSVESTNVTGAGPGVLVNGPVPSQVAGLITLRTASAGKAFRGRKYIGLLDRSFVSNSGEPTAGLRTALALIAAAWATAQVVASGGNNATLQPVIYHKFLGTTDDITGSVVRTYFGTQRRRGDASGGDATIFP